MAADKREDSNIEYLPDQFTLLRYLEGREGLTAEQKHMRDEKDPLWTLREIQACLYLMSTQSKPKQAEFWIDRGIKSIKTTSAKEFEDQFYDLMAAFLQRMDELPSGVRTRCLSKAECLSKFVKRCPPEQEISLMKSIARRELFSELETNVLANYTPGPLFCEFVYGKSDVPTLHTFLTHQYPGIEKCDAEGGELPPTSYTSFEYKYPGIDTGVANTIDAALVRFAKGQLQSDGLSSILDSVIKTLDQTAYSSIVTEFSSKHLSEDLKALSERVDEKFRTELADGITKMRKNEFPSFPGFSPSSGIGKG